MIDFITRQIKQILEKGSGELVRKVNIISIISGKFLAYLPLFIIAIPFVVLIRIIRPFILIRLEGLLSHRIGHFAGNVEIYLCEQKAGINKPAQCHVDIFYMADKPVCNQQLATMVTGSPHLACLDTGALRPSQSIDCLYHPIL